MSNSPASSRTPSPSSTDEPGSETQGAETRKFTVEERSGKRSIVWVTMGDSSRIHIKDISQLPTYRDWFENKFADEEDYEDFYKDYDRIYKELIRNGIGIRGRFDCVDRLLDISNPLASLKASHGFLFYNQDHDVVTYGTEGSLTGVTIPAVQAHIERRKEDRKGRAVNRLTLRRRTLYLLRGHEECTLPEGVEFHDDMTIYRAPRAHVDQILMCDMYNYPEVNHLSVTRETRRGRELLTQISKSEDYICVKCLAKENTLYYENCHEEFCSISSLLNRHGPTTRIVSNDELFASFGAIPLRAVRLSHRHYAKVLKATELVARLYGNSPRDFVQEIIQTARCSPITFLRVSAVSQKIRNLFGPQNTCYMLAPGEKGQLVQTAPLKVDFDVRMVAAEIDGQLVDHVHFHNFSLTAQEVGIYHLSPSAEPYTGPRKLGLISLGVEG